jgi:carbonic anhydrase
MIDDLLERNRAYAAGASADLPKLPERRLVVLTCMDHRIDPVAALGLELGDAMVVRNAGGRVTPRFLETLGVLDRIAAKQGSGLGEFELILMQHTECGAGGLADSDPDALAAYLGVTPDELESKSAGDPYAGIRVDLDALASNPAVPDSLSVAGLVYDVNTRHAELIERRAPLRGRG